MLADVTHGGTWHIGVLAGPGMPEMLLAGRDREFLGQFAFPAMSATPGAITDTDINEFVRTYSRPDAARSDRPLPVHAPRRRRDRNPCRRPQTEHPGAGDRSWRRRVHLRNDDFRLVRDQDPDVLLADLRAYLDAAGYDDVEIVRLMTAQPVATDLHDPLVAQIRGIAERACNAVPRSCPTVLRLNRSLPVYETDLASLASPPPTTPRTKEVLFTPQTNISALRISNPRLHSAELRSLNYTRRLGRPTCRTQLVCLGGERL